MSEIVNVRAREVLDSRGNPTVEADVITAAGAFGRQSAVGGLDRVARGARARDGDKRRYSARVCSRRWVTPTAPCATCSSA